MTAPIKLYRNPKSGHCHRVELMMAMLDVPYETIDLDMANGAHKAPESLKLSPLGQVPAIDDNGTVLSDSNAILAYLAATYGDDVDWTGRTPVEKAKVQRWLSIAAGEIASGPAAARLVSVFGAGLDQAASGIGDRAMPTNFGCASMRAIQLWMLGYASRWTPPSGAWAV